MDRRELVESSSSQSVNPTIVRISARGTSGSSFRLELSDGSFFCVRADVLLEKRLNRGLELDEKMLFFLEREDSLLSCREKTVELLTRRDHCRKEIYLKLLKREFTPAQINPVLDEMEERGYLDDLRFAQKRAVQRIRKANCGRTAVMADLLSKGVRRETATEAISDMLKQSDFDAALERAAGKLTGKSGMTAKRLRDSLMRKGFSWREISDIIRQFEKDLS